MTSDTAPHDARSRQVELLISHLLRIGVVTSLAIVIAGTVVTFVRHPAFLSQPHALDHLTSDNAAFPYTPVQIVTDFSQYPGRSMIMVGLMLLIATPVMRVGVSIFAFVYEHDRRYVIITSIVFALLILSFLIGKAGE